MNQIQELFKDQIISLFKRKTQIKQWIHLPAPSKEMIKEVRTFASEVIPVKLKEAHHRVDNNNEWKRVYNGKMSEYVIRQYLGQEKPDMTVGPSSKYNVADIKIGDLNFGIKCTELGKAAMIHKVPERHEIVMLINEGEYFICGIASKKNLTIHQDDSLIVNATNYNKSCLNIEGYKDLTPFQKLIEYISDRKPQIATS